MINKAVTKKKNSLIMATFSDGIPRFIVDMKRDGLSLDPDLFRECFTKISENNYTFELDVNWFLYKYFMMVDPLDSNKRLVGFKIPDKQLEAYTDCSEEFTNVYENTFHITNVSADINAVAVYGKICAYYSFKEDKFNGYSYPVHVDYSDSHGEIIYAGYRFGDIISDDKIRPLDSDLIQEEPPKFDLLGWSLKHGSRNVLDMNYTFKLNDLPKTVGSYVNFYQVWDNLHTVKLTYRFSSGSTQELYVESGKLIPKDCIPFQDPNDFTKKVKSCRHNGNLIDFNTFLVPNSDFIIDVDTITVPYEGEYTFIPHNHSYTIDIHGVGYWKGDSEGGGFGYLNPKTLFGLEWTGFASVIRNIHMTSFAGDIEINVDNNPKYPNLLLVLWPNGWITPYTKDARDETQSIGKYLARGSVDLADFGYSPSSTDTNINIAIVDESKYKFDHWDLPIPEGGFSGRFRFVDDTDPEYGSGVLGYVRNKVGEQLSGGMVYGGVIEEIQDNLIISNMNEDKRFLYLVGPGVIGPVLYRKIKTEGNRITYNPVHYYESFYGLSKTSYITDCDVFIW